MVGTPAADTHRRRLEAWRQRHPDSPHGYLDLGALEELKRRNDELNARDQRLRPAVCESYPVFLTVGNTHKCNLTCQMCFKQLDDADNMSLPDLGLGMFERVAHEVFPHLRHVALSVTGEPLVSGSIFDELDLMVTYGVRCMLTSNGMPLSRTGLLERMMPATERLTISMDGASEPVFNAIRRQAKFDRVIKNIRRFNEARDALPADAHRPELQFSNTLQHRNVTELPQLIELAHELQVDRVYVDHVYIHHQLNAGDSLHRHRRLANEMIERARARAAQLKIDVRLPTPFDLADGEPDAPYEPLATDALLEQGRVRLETVKFDPRVHLRTDLDPEFMTLAEVRAQGGGNREYVERLLERRSLLGHLSWGVPQLGASLIPPGSEKVSACGYAWRESYVEWDGTIAPCCNASMGAGRLLGHLDDAPTFRDLWNGEAYQRLRASLSSGSCYKFCRTCHLVENVDEAAWGTNETWFKVATVLEGGEPRAAGEVPPGKRLVLTEVRSSAVRAGAELELFADETPIATVAAVEQDGVATFRAALHDVAVVDAAVVYLRCKGEERVEVELLGFAL